MSVSEELDVRILALNGSPHRSGNTATLMEWVLEGCAEAGAKCTWLHLVDYDVGYCQGCNTCIRTGECPIRDDVPRIRDRLLAADGIVVGSPVYEGQPTAQLKTLMDRLALLVLYTDLFARQRSVGVATSGLAPTRGTAKAAEMFGLSSGIIGARTSSLSRGYQPLSERHAPRLPGRARALGRKLVRDVRSSDRALDVKQLYMEILRSLLNRFLVRRNPEQFAGAMRIQQERRRLTRM
jgi:NAD(P)H-dependent FMN reductase